ncbi:hypothetical protein TNCV_3076911 [Trichonephila clavipes]|nr:hypothetical protein TNCV_3076911 [Trichonephila clavipes]
MERKKGIRTAADSVQIGIRKHPLRICNLDSNGRNSSPTWYGGYDTRLVIKWARVRIPTKTWMYIREKKSDSLLKWVLVSNGKQSSPFVLC